MIPALWLVMTALVGALLWIHTQKRAALERGRERRLGRAERRSENAEWLVKPAAAATFIVTGVAAGAASTPHGCVMIGGLVLAAVGDVLLIPKNKRSFLAGLVAFLLGHVAYAIAFAMRGPTLMWSAGALALLCCLAIPILKWLWPNVEKPMRGPVAAYVTVITSMVALAAGAAHVSGVWWLLIGAFGFYLSDLFVARERFVDRGVINKLIGLPLYFYSQMILATTA